MAFDSAALAAGASEDNKRQTIVLHAYIKRIAELEAALREDHDTFAHMRNDYPFTQGDPLAGWDGVIRKRVAAIRELLKPI